MSLIRNYVIKIKINGRANWEILIFSSTGLYGDKILIGNFSIKKKDQNITIPKVNL